MTVSIRILRGTLLHLMARLRGNGFERNYAGDEAPLRSELFSSDQMKQHGKALAESHKLSADMARSSPPLVSSFVAEFTRRLQGQIPALALPLTWIEQPLNRFRVSCPTQVPCWGRSES